MNRGTKRFQREWDGDLLRNWRVSKGLTIEQAAPRLGISFQSLSRVERGYVPHIELANRIVQVTKGEIRYRDIFHNFQPEYA